MLRNARKVLRASSQSVTSFTMDNDLEKLYSPSQWCKRCSPQEVINEFYDFTTAKTAEVESDVQAEKDVRFGPGDKMLVDIFGKDSLAKDSPILVYIHGGFWQEGSKDCFGFFKEFLLRGIRVIVPGYDLAPQVSLGEIMDEMTTLFSFLRRYASDNNVRDIWLCGHSAGAQLALSAFHNNPPILREHTIKGFILISGIYSLGPIVLTSNNIKLKLSEEDAVKFSPINWKYDESTVKGKITFLVAVGQHESPAFIEQSSQYAQMLEKQGARVKHILVSNCDHFNIITNLFDNDFILTSMIIDLILKPDKEISQ